MQSEITYDYCCFTDKQHFKTTAASEQKSTDIRGSAWDLIHCETYGCIAQKLRRKQQQKYNRNNKIFKAIHNMQTSTSIHTHTHTDTPHHHDTDTTPGGRLGCHY